MPLLAGVKNTRIAAVLFAFAMLHGCTRDEKPRTTSESAAGLASDAPDSEETTVSPDAAPAIEVLRDLADRDEALIEIARLAITRREQLRVSADARRLLTEQRRESNRLVGMLKGEYQLTHQPTISARDQPVLDSLNGLGLGEFDRAFLDVVSRHYDGDVRLIDEALPNIKLAGVRDLLTEIRAKRSTEAAALRRRLDVLRPPPPPPSAR